MGRKYCTPEYKVKSAQSAIVNGHCWSPPDLSKPVRLVTNTSISKWTVFIHLKALLFMRRFEQGTFYMKEAILEALTLILVMYVISDVIEIPSTVTSLKSYYRSQFKLSKCKNMVSDPGIEPHQCLFASIWMRMARVPRWPPRGQQVSHQR